ncbi:MAG: NAD-dependent epimerase/dehydratase family protein [Actinomycetota bacterium]
MRILVTGGAGFVGSHLSRRLMDEGAEVFTYDSFQHYLPPIPVTYVENMNYRFQKLLDGAHIEWGATQSKEDFRAYARRVQPQCVIHLAALAIPSVARSHQQEAFDSILLGSVNVLDVLREIDSVERFVYVSSSMVYGDFTQNPMPEDGAKDPKEIYGGLKLSGEILTRVLSGQHDVPYSIVRPSAAYGPTDNNRRVLQIFIENAIRGEGIKAANPGSTFLDFTYVSDLADGIARVATSPAAAREDFNITRGEQRSLGEAIDILSKIFPDLEIEREEGVADFRPSRGTLDISKARELVGYSPRYSLEAGIEEYVRFMVDHNPSLGEGRPTFRLQGNQVVRG